MENFKKFGKFLEIWKIKKKSEHLENLEIGDIRKSRNLWQLKIKSQASSALKIFALFGNFFKNGGRRRRRSDKQIFRIARNLRDQK